MARGVILERKVSANVASRQAIAERLVGLQTDIGNVTFEVYDSTVISYWADPTELVGKLCGALAKKYSSARKLFMSWMR